jgi:hypothetical protein
MPHRIGRELGCAGLADDVIDLGDAPEGLLKALIHRHRLGERDAREAARLDEQITLVQLGHELGPEAREEQERGGEQRGRGRQDRPPAAEDEGERGTIERVGLAEQPGLVCALARADEIARQDRHDREREDEGPSEREQHRGGHGPEELALDPDQREHRQVDDGDDRLAEHRGAAHLERGEAHHLDALSEERRLAAPALLLREPAHRVLDDDHRAVDDQAEVDGAEAHQVPGDVGRVHHRDREEHRERDGRGDDEPAAQLAEEDEEDEDDQRRALEQVLADRTHGAVHQLRAVVEWLDPRALRQGRRELRELEPSRLRSRCESSRPCSISATPTTTSPLPSFEAAPMPHPRSELHVGDRGERDGSALRGRGDDDPFGDRRGS